MKLENETENSTFFYWNVPLRSGRKNTKRGTGNKWRGPPKASCCLTSKIIFFDDFKLRTNNFMRQQTAAAAAQPSAASFPHTNTRQTHPVFSNRRTAPSVARHSLESSSSNSSSSSNRTSSSNRRKRKIERRWCTIRPSSRREETIPSR